MRLASSSPSPATAGSDPAARDAVAGARSRERPTCLVEAGYGIGDVIEASQTCRALWGLGYEVDFLVSRLDDGRTAALFEGLAPYGRVLRAPREVDASRYDVGVACFGPSKAVRRVTPGFWFHVTLRDVVRSGLAAANFEPARALGHVGPPPPHLLRVEEGGAAAPAGYVVVHAGSDPHAAYKRWPGWEAVCDDLARRGVPVVVVGTEGDTSATGWERRFDLRLGLPLPRLAALLRGARAYFGTDSGVTHLAGALGTPGLALFGPTDPRTYAPTSGSIRVLDVPPRDGERRYPAPLPRPEMARLSGEDVTAEVLRTLRDPPAASLAPLGERRATPPGDPEARLPTSRDLRATPATLEAVDALLRRITTSAILGLLARRGDATATRDWRAQVARAIGHAHLRAARVRRASGTWIGHRRARNHLHQARRAGYALPAALGRLRLALTPSSRLTREHDPLRH